MDTNQNLNSTNPSQKWYYRLWFVIVMLVTIGPFAFPLLWKSKEFGIKTKWALTIIFMAVTISAIWGSVETIKFVIRHFQELQDAISS